jgi:hypothetical protein
MRPTPYNPQTLSQVETDGKIYIVHRKGFPPCKYISKYDAIASLAQEEAGQAFVNDMLERGIWPALTLRQEIVAIAMFHGNKAILPCWAGTYACPGHGILPVLCFGKDQRALNADGFDMLHIQNKHNCKILWREN